MPLFLQAITPKKFQVFDDAKIRQGLKTDMNRYLEGIKKEMQEYPPKRARPRKYYTKQERIQRELLGQSTRSRNEPSRGYDRTETLMRSWKVVVAPDGSNGVLFNDAKNRKGRQYAVYVQGPRGGGRGKGRRQAKFLRDLGWQSITDVSRRHRKEFATIVNKRVAGSPR